MGISINLTEGVGHCSPVTNMHNRKRDRSSQQFVADGSQEDLKGFLVAGDDEDLCLRPGVHVPFETLGAFLVHSWCILGAFLVHSWCIQMPKSQKRWLAPAVQHGFSPSKIFQGLIQYMEVHPRVDLIARTVKAASGDMFHFCLIFLSTGLQAMANSSNMVIVEHQTRNFGTFRNHA